MSVLEEYLELVRAATAEIESLRQQLAESKVILQEAQAPRSRLAEETERGNYWFDQHHACENELKRVRAQLADTEALIHEAVELLRMWVIWDSMADDAKPPRQKTDTFLLLRRAADHRENDSHG
jgi:multidrug resistance efflux pump